MNIGQALTLIRSQFSGVLDTLSLTADRVYSLPDKTGTIALLDDISTSASFSQVLSITSDRTLIATDVGKFILCSNTGDITITIPDDTTSIPVSSEIEVTRDNTGRVYVARANTNVTMAGDSRVNTTLQILAQHHSVTLKKVASNNWRVYGSLAW